jgi:hypothetical protein
METFGLAIQIERQEIIVGEALIMFPGESLREVFPL